MILRVFPTGDPAAADEERALTAIDTLGGLAPRLLARGDEDDKTPSWVLISRLPGTADIIPADPRSWAVQLGRTLARIHATDVATDVAADLDTVFDRRGYRARLFGPAARIVDEASDGLSTPGQVQFTPVEGGPLSCVARAGPGLERGSQGL